MAEDKKSDDFYINDDVFESHAIGSLGLHRAEAERLRIEIMAALKSEYRHEGWEFIREIYRINSHKEWSYEDTQSALAKVVADYIEPEKINIHGDETHRLLNIKEYKVSDFNNIIPELYRLSILEGLNTNVMAKLLHWDAMLVNALETTKLLSTASRSPTRDAFFEANPEEKWVKSSRQIAKTALENVFDLLNKANKISIPEFTKNFQQILSDATSKLKAQLPQNPKNPLPLQEFERLANNLDERALSLSTNSNSNSVIRRSSDSNPSASR